MRRNLGFAAGAALLAAGLAVACRKEEAPAQVESPPAGTVEPAAAAPAAASAELVGGGRYLVTIIGCNDCHTPYKMGKTGPEPDMTRMLSGHPEGMKLPPPPKLEGPWEMVATNTLTAWAGPWASVTPRI